MCLFVRKTITCNQQVHRSSSMDATQLATPKVIQLKCDPRFTGSYGSLYAFLEDGKLKQSWHDLCACKSMFDVHSDAKSARLSEKFKDKTLECMATPGMAVKLIKIHHEVPSKRGLIAFQDETSKIRLIKKALGSDFELYTCIRSVTKGGPFSIMLNVRPEFRHTLSFELILGDEIYTTHQLFLILQEQGSCDLRTLMRTRPADIDLQELDANVSRFMAALHSKDIVHKDIKPANIVYFPASPIRYKVIDYGLCSSLSDPSQSWKAKGTPGYMSPVFLHSNGYSMSKIYANYVNKRIHKNLYGLAVEKYRSRFHSLPLHKSQAGDKYQLILKKNDEFAYAIILLELQFMSQSTLSLKRKLNQLLGYDKMYFEPDKRT